MPNLSEADLARIEAAVEEAEKATAAEIVCVVTKQSEDFRLLGVAWAAVLSLAVPWVLLLATPWPVTALLVSQMVVFLLLVLLLTQTPALLWVVPKGWARREAAQAAREQFLLHGMHRSPERMGVMLYVSLAEHYAEILADVGLEDRVDASVWRDAIDALATAAKAGGVTDGIVAAIEHCAPALAVAAPVGEEGGNGLSNRPIII